MRGRTRAGGSAHERIMEIVCFLLRRILESPEEARSEGNLVKGLEERGYGQAEIETAIELVFAVPEIITSATETSRRVKIATTRVFSPTEEVKLGLAVRGHLLQYREFGLLTELEWEEVLMHLLMIDSKEVGLADLHHAIRKVVGDENRLLLLLPNGTQPIYPTIN